MNKIDIIILEENRKTCRQYYITIWSYGVRMTYSLNFKKIIRDHAIIICGKK